MRSWQSKQNSPDPSPEGADGAPAEAFKTGLYARSKVNAQAIRKVRIKTVYLVALVPVILGAVLFVVVPALVVDLTPRDGVDGGSSRDRDLARIDPTEGMHPDRPTPERGPEGVMISIEHSLQVRIGAARELGRSGTPAALDALLRGAKSLDAQTRRAAAVGLTRRIYDPQANQALWELLSDADPGVAQHTATVLGAVEGSQALLMGRLDLSDSDSKVHLACLRALPYVGESSTVPVLMRFVSEPGDLGKTAADTVWKICKRTQTPLPSNFPSKPPRR